MNEKQDYCLADISACNHCRYFFEDAHYSVGGQYCSNKKSPFFHDDFQRNVRIINETLPGCEHFALKGKIPRDLYHHLPSDSPIRKLPLEEVISDYHGEQDLMSTKTSKEVIEEVITNWNPSQVIREMIPAD